MGRGRESALDEMVEAQPVLVRISAAKRLRDAAEREAQRAGEQQVTSLTRIAGAHGAGARTGGMSRETSRIVSE